MIRNLQIMGVALITVVVAILIWTVFSKNPLGKPNTYIDLSRPSVVKEMQALNRLETASFTIEKIVEAGQQGNAFQDLLYGDRILLVAHGKVVAGIDMSQVKESDVNVSGNKVTINLPAPQILSSTLDNSKTSVYDRTQGFLSRGNKDLESEARRAAEGAIKSAACEAGIMQEAKNNAGDRIRQLFQFAGFSEVIVNVPNGGC